MHYGQASIEYMFLLGFSLMIAGIIWFVATSQTQDMLWDLRVNTAKGSLEKITNAADEVYVQGPPAQVYLHVDIPDGTNAVYLYNNYVTIELDWKGELRNITRTSITNMTGNINPARGIHTLLVVGENPVSITEV